MSATRRDVDAAAAAAANVAAVLYHFCCSLCLRVPVPVCVYKLYTKLMRCAAAGELSTVAASAAAASASAGSR